MTSDPIARVEMIDGQIVLIDPVAAGMIRAVARHNCFLSAQLHRERLGHFARRITELGRNPADTIITLLNADDPFGAALAAYLMPRGWDTAIREAGARPWARGLVDRVSLSEFFKNLAITAQVPLLAGIAMDVVAELDAIPGIAVLIADNDTITAFTLEELTQEPRPRPLEFLDVECPFCKAAPGSPCRTRRHDEYLAYGVGEVHEEPHADRVQLKENQ